MHLYSATGLNIKPVRAIWLSTLSNRRGSNQMMPRCTSSVSQTKKKKTRAEPLASTKILHLIIGGYIHGIVAKDSRMCWAHVSFFISRRQHNQRTTNAQAASKLGSVDTLKTLLKPSVGPGINNLKQLKQSTSPISSQSATCHLSLLFAVFHSWQAFVIYRVKPSQNKRTAGSTIDRLLRHLLSEPPVTISCH